MFNKSFQSLRLGALGFKVERLVSDSKACFYMFWVRSLRLHGSGLFIGYIEFGMDGHLHRRRWLSVCCSYIDKILIYD